MNIISESITSALERALTGESTVPLTKEDLINKSKSEISEAVRAALSDPKLLSALSDPDLATKLLLDVACRGHEDQVRGAMHHGASVNARNEHGETALILATKSGHTSRGCVKALLKHPRIDVHVAAGAGTALHIAAAAGDEETCLLLLDAGADPYEKDPGGTTGDGRTPRPPAGCIALMEAEWMEPYNVFAHYAERHAARKRSAERLKQYVDGSLGRHRWPPFYAGAQRPWTVHSHKYCPRALRDAVRLMLLASSRRTPGEVCCLPSELWLQVFKRMDRDWCRDEIEPLEVPNAEHEQAPRRARFATADLAGLKANVAAQQQAQLDHVVKEHARYMRMGLAPQGRSMAQMALAIPRVRADEVEEIEETEDDLLDYSELEEVD